MNGNLAEYKNAAEAMILTKEMKKIILRSTRIALRFRKIESWGEAYMEMECFKEMRDASGKTHDLAIGFFCSRGHYIGNGTADELRTVASDPPFGAYKVYSAEEHNLFRPESGYWSISHFNQPTHERAIFKLLPAGAKLRFTVKLDGLTSPIMALAGLHGDYLELYAVKGQQQYCLQLDTALCKHNSARFGYTV
jgi:hypothetical protein